MTDILTVTWSREQAVWRCSAPPGPAGTAGIDLVSASGEPWLRLDVDMVDPSRAVGVVLEATDWWPRTDEWLPSEALARFAAAERAAGQTADTIEMELDLSGTRLGEAWRLLCWAARLDEDLQELSEGVERGLCALEFLDICRRVGLDPGWFGAELEHLASRAGAVELPPGPLADEVSGLLQRHDLDLTFRGGPEAGDLPSFKGGPDAGDVDDVELPSFRGSPVPLAEVEPVRSGRPADEVEPLLSGELSWVEENTARFAVDGSSAIGTLDLRADAVHVTVPTAPGYRPTVYVFDDDGTPLGAAILERAGDHGAATGAVRLVDRVRPAFVYAGPSPDRDADRTYLQQLEEAIRRGREALYADLVEPGQSAFAWSDAAHHFLGVGHVVQAIQALRRQALAETRVGVASERSSAWADAWTASCVDEVPAVSTEVEHPLWLRIGRR